MLNVPGALKIIQYFSARDVGTVYSAAKTISFAPDTIAGAGDPLSQRNVAGHPFPGGPCYGFATKKSSLLFFCQHASLSFVQTGFSLP